MSSATILQHKYFPSYATLDMHLTRLLTLLLLELRTDFSPRKRSLGQLQQKIFDFSRGKKKTQKFLLQEIPKLSIFNQKNKSFLSRKWMKIQLPFLQTAKSSAKLSNAVFHLISVSPLLTCFSTLKVNKLTWDTSNNHEKEINTQPRLGCDLWER